MMVMDTNYYVKNMHEHLNSSGCYKNLCKNPLHKIMNDMTEAIKKSSLDDAMKEKLTLNYPLGPRIYGLALIHKKNIPIRSIINTIGSHNYLLTKYLANKLKCLVGNANSCDKDYLFF